MAIDFIIGESCEVKKATTLDSFLTLMKEKIRVEAVTELLRGQGKSENEILETSFTSRLLMPDGNVNTTECKIAELIDKTKCMDELKICCEECPIANGKEFGCYNSINYPISEKAEGWLKKLAEQAMQKNTGLEQAPLDFIIKNKVKGDIFKSMRKDRSKAFFQTTNDIELIYKKTLFRKQKINTNQLLEVLFGSRVVERSQQMALLYFSGGFCILDGLPDSSVCGKMFEIPYEDGTKQWYVFDLTEELEDDQCIQQIKGYFHSLFLAFCTGQVVIIDY